MLQILKVEIVSNNKDKFHFACKLMHELAANVFESFKLHDKRHFTNIQHRFKIIKTDYNLCNMDFIN